MIAKRAKQFLSANIKADSGEIWVLYTGAEEEKLSE